MLVIYRSVQGIGYHTGIRRAWTPTGEWVWSTWCKSQLNSLQCVARVRRCLCAQLANQPAGAFCLEMERNKDSSNCARANGGFTDLIQRLSLGLSHPH